MKFLADVEYDAFCYVYQGEEINDKEKIIRNLIIMCFETWKWIQLMKKKKENENEINDDSFKSKKWNKIKYETFLKKKKIIYRTRMIHIQKKKKRIIK